jgi:hypothetical protein
MHGGVSTAIAGHQETPCPYSNVAGDANDELLKAKADAFVKSAVQAITSRRAWTGHSAIFIAADESDFDGSNASDNFYLSTAGLLRLSVRAGRRSGYQRDLARRDLRRRFAPMIVISHSLWPLISR